MRRLLTLLTVTALLLSLVVPSVAFSFHGVEMTYAAAGSNGITVADNSNLDYATGNFFGGVLATIPDYTPSAEVVLDTKHDGSNGRTFSIQTNGKLRLTINANNYDSTVATGLTDGTRHFLSYAVERETATVDGSVRFEVDGVTLGTAVSITAGAPATVSNAVAQYVLGTSAKREAGIASKFYSYNRALSAAEVLSLYQSGVATADQWGSQTAKYTSNFSAGTDSWAAARGAATGNIDGIGGYNDVLRFTCTDITNNTHYLYRNTTLTLNKKNRISFEYYIQSGQSNIDSIVIKTENESLGTLSATDTWTSVTVETTPTANTYLYFYASDGGNTTFQDAGGDDVFYIKNVVVTLLGATLDLEPPGIGASDWQDSSTNNLDASYPTTGYRLFYHGLRTLLGVGQ